MNRIEKIKERLKANEGQFHKDKIALDDDVQYLLSKLEIAEKNLGKMASGGVLMFLDGNPVGAYKEYAKHTLNKIREEEQK
jgi:hypothetical protein